MGFAWLFLLFVLGCFLFVRLFGSLVYFFCLEYFKSIGLGLLACLFHWCVWGFFSVYVILWQRGIFENI